MSSLATKLALSGSILLVGAAVVWKLAPDRARDDGDTVRLVDTTDDVLDLFESRGPEPGGEELSSDALWDGPADVGELDAESAGSFYPTLRNDKSLFVPHIWYRPRGPIRAELPFQEHPDGSYPLWRNRQGLREDRNLVPEPLDGFRVLVTGDSHTEGVCPNAASFANLLEAMLAERNPATAVDVVNAGIGGYNLYNYLGAAEHYEALEPDVLVVTIYGGNDFSNTMVMQRYFKGREAPTFGPIRTRDLLGRGREFRPFVSQHLLQAAYFLNNPDDLELAAPVAFRLCRELAQRCAERRIVPLFVYLPPFSSAQPDSFPPEHLALAEELLGCASGRAGTRRTGSRTRCWRSSASTATSRSTCGRRSPRTRNSSTGTPTTTSTSRGTARSPRRCWRSSSP